jgi:hypothetical protein
MRMTYEYSKSLSNGGDAFLENNAFGGSALYEPNIVWYQRGYGNAALESLNRNKRKYTINQVCTTRQ